MSDSTSILKPFFRRPSISFCHPLCPSNHGYAAISRARLMSLSVRSIFTASSRPHSRKSFARIPRNFASGIARRVDSNASEIEPCLMTL